MVDFLQQIMDGMRTVLFPPHLDMTPGWKLLHSLTFLLLILFFIVEAYKSYFDVCSVF
jgi:hypothetical protein